MTWQSFAIVDWSGGRDTGPTPKKDAIWIAAVIAGEEREPVYFRNRAEALGWLSGLIVAERNARRRLMIGFDFPFGYPSGFGKRLTGSEDPLEVWAWLRQRLVDRPGRNNRFALAGKINARFPGTGPFWFNGEKDDIANLPRKGSERTGHGQRERREVEELAPGTFSPWQMGGAGAVGSQAMTGMAGLDVLLERFRGDVSVWPFEPLDRSVALVEVWPSLVDDVVRDEGDEIRDRAQVRVMARALAGLTEDDLAAMLDVPPNDEGWILGVGHEDKLREASLRARSAPAFRNDCFALPPGVDWTPVDEAIDRLEASMKVVAKSETLPVAQAFGRFLAADAVARRSHPPAANSAVDGWGLASADLGEGPYSLPVAKGRAAAGAPFEGRLPDGHAIRVLTGALLPQGVDTVVLDEDTSLRAGHAVFAGPLKAGANTRAAGEDTEAGQVAVPSGTLIGPGEIALLSATGVAEVQVRKPLAVAVLSTGDELTEPSADPAAAARTYDANRPMLLSMLRAWGIEAHDIGIVADSRDAVRQALDTAARECDAILTSGGASAGDEDHVSALLGETGSRRDWRIALKPGRPLALGVWQGRPVFGLPGNPVAAMVCALIFARPALLRMAGGPWAKPQGFMVPAAFEKRKKGGRREFLRARMTPDGEVEVFASEGSGRVSGLSWATGLVELSDGRQHIRYGDLVRFLPFSSFGL